MESGISSLPARSAPLQPAVLVVAHPGHELRVHGWLEQARPRVHVLTDGSGRTGRSRLASTEALLEGAGAAPGAIFGRLSDAQAYAALLERKAERFVELTDELADELVCGQIQVVAGDACEGYNPMHDACRLIIDAAVAIARQRRGQAIASYHFPLIGKPDACPESDRLRAVWVHLDDAAFARKLAAAQAYPELAAELAAALAANGLDAFRVECLRPAAGIPGLSMPPEDPPYYERYGQKQVDAGFYEHVIRYRRHLRPLGQALRRHVAKVT
jgi:hypothetical protein